MLKDKQLTYITLFSSAGVGCYGFKMEGYQCIATNEILSKRMNIQIANKICEYESGYVIGDISSPDVKERIYAETLRWQKKGNDKVDVLLATPPCQDISVINHKKNNIEISRNSLVVDSIEIITKVKPRVFIFENVMAFQKHSVPHQMVRLLKSVTMFGNPWDKTI
jgi:DNA (cytosine-5)-methyltransferase 1